jgi:hypothetical protein
VIGAIHFTPQQLRESLADLKVREGLEYLFGADRVLIYELRIV